MQNNIDEYGPAAPLRAGHTPVPDHEKNFKGGPDYIEALNLWNTTHGLI